jgi:uncharacterized protein
MQALATSTIEPHSGSSHPFRILSIDGGGAKGFYTLGILSEIEAMARKPICECFDLIFGTSTGAIIAALLARGDSVDAVHDLYKKHVPTIMKGFNTSSRTRALRALAKTVFEDKGPEIFKTGIGLVATNWNEERPLIFKASVDQAHGLKATFAPFFGCTVADAIIASCSAYPFFKRHTITKSNGDVLKLADGGFCANNPTLYAIADATIALKKSAEDIRIVSLGVGSYPQPSLLKRAGRMVGNLKLLRYLPSSSFLQTVLGTNTTSMDVLRNILFKNIPTIRISDSFTEPHMATDLLEHNLVKLNRLVQKGRLSFGAREAELKKFLLD